MRIAPQLVETAERRAVFRGREHRAGGEVDPDSDHLRRIDTGLGEERGHRLPKGRDVVVRILERPVRLEADVLIGSRKAFVDHAVAVAVNGGAELTAVGAVDEDGTARLGAEVDADGVPAAPAERRRTHEQLFCP